MRVRPNALLLLAAVLPATYAVSAPPISFAARLGLTIPGEIFTTGDFNKDGFQDVIAAIPNPNSTNNEYALSVQLGNGKGGFTQGPVYDLGASFSPSAIAAADVNGDGLLDVVVLSANTNALYILLQRKGREPVITPVEIFNAGGAENIGIGDVNGDGRPDIVIPSGNGTYLLTNEGRGNFSAPALAGAQGASFVVLADVNNDKHLDLVLSNGGYCCGASVSVLIGDGHGNFTPASSQPNFSSTEIEIAVADFNQDGKLDIAAGIEYAGEVQIALGNGDGTFQIPQALFLPSPLYQTYGVAAGDLNKDGIPDLVALGFGNNGVSMVTFLNQGGAVFTTGSTYPVQANAAYLELAPLVTRTGNGAALDSLVFSPNGGEVVSVLLNKGNGVFSDGLVEGPSSAALYLVSGDFNNDGRVDIASASAAGLSVLLSTGSNSSPFTVETPLPFFTGPLVAGDFNRDGRLDLVTLNGATGDFLIGEGNGSFRLKTPAFNVGLPAAAATAADMNGDGKLDIVTGAPAIILGSGGGNFQPPYVAPYGNCGSLVVAVADLTGDGKPDVLTTCFNSLQLYPGNGDGTLAYPSDIAYSNYPIDGLATGDFNGDGIPDFVFAATFYSPSSTGTLVTVELGNGNGTFRQTAAVGVPGGSYYTAGQLTLGNFNGDDKLDVAVLDESDAIVVVLPGNGDGTFGAPALYGTGSNPTCIVAAGIQSPARPLDEDLLFCSAQGVSLDFNTTK